LTQPNLFVFVPGLSQTITVPANSVLYISTDGGAATTSSSTTGFSVVDVALVVDGSLRPNAGFRRLIINNTSSVIQQLVNWGMADSVVLTAGAHTIQVAAELVLGSSATVSGASNSVLQGQLTVAVVKQ